MAHYIKIMENFYLHKIKILVVLTELAKYAT